MDKTTQDLAWSVLPKEFKKEVKEIYDSGIKMMDIRPSASQIYANKLSTLEGIFGIHNLTSDTEGEEMLTVSRKRVQDAYLNCDRYFCYEGMLEHLFGSKCRPDEGTDCTPVEVGVAENTTTSNVGSLEPKSAEPKFKYELGDKVRIANDVRHMNKYLGDVTEIVYVDESDPETPYKVDIYDEHFGGGLWYLESDLEPCTEPTDLNKSSETCTDNCSSQNHFVVKDEMVDNIIKDGFHEHNRLHIASLAMAGLLANQQFYNHRLRSY